MAGINVMGYDLEEVGKEINTPKKSSSYTDDHGCSYYYERASINQKEVVTSYKML